MAEETLTFHVWSLYVKNKSLSLTCVLLSTTEDLMLYNDHIKTVHTMKMQLQMLAINPAAIRRQCRVSVFYFLF